MPTPLVLVEVGSGRVLYTNAAAEPFAFAYQPTEDQPAFEKGRRLAASELPHAVAARGVSIDDDRVIEFRDATGASRWLLFHAQAVPERGLALITFEDVTTLHETQVQLEQAVLARDELVSMASHELRSPLGAITLAVEQICRKAATHHLADVDRLGVLALRQVRRLNVLVGNLLDVSRLRAGRFELDVEHAKLCEIVRDACEAFPGVDVTCSTDGDGLWDAVRIAQAVSNLVGNAQKYGNGAAIRVRIDEPRAGEARIAVEDDGPGIPRDARGRIFEPFQRADGRYKAQSLGLGLYIVREVTQAHGGTIELTSPANPTCFTITLPVRHGQT